MGKRVYYNELDKKAAAWIRQQIADGLLPDGDVDERSIADVQPDDLAGYTHVHLFAGIGGWAHAAQLARWPLDAPLWTGSCPCQPFSPAGPRTGTSDPRHLWPHMYRLIRGGRPPCVVGEQTTGTSAYAWFNGVRSDLGEGGYQARPVDIPAAGVDAPHRRNRIYWAALADASSGGRPESVHRVGDGSGTPWNEGSEQADGIAGFGPSGGRALADANGSPTGQQPRVLRGDEGEHDERQAHGDHVAAADGGSGGESGVAHAASARGGSGFRQEGAVEHGYGSACGRSGNGQRFVAHTDRAGCSIESAPRLHGRRQGEVGAEPAQGYPDGAFGHDADGCSGFGDMGHASRPGLPSSECEAGERAGYGQEGRATAEPSSPPVRKMGDAQYSGRTRRDAQRSWPSAVVPSGGGYGPNGSFWSDSEWLIGADGKARRAQSGIRLLVNGLPGRGVLLRGYGNAVVVPLAAEVLIALRETYPHLVAVHDEYEELL